MAVDPVSAGLGAVSLISGKKQNDKARKDANEAGQFSKELEKRAVQLWDVLFNRAKAAEEGGQFDPEKRIAALEQDTARYEGKDLGNLAGAMRVSGYKPGDSEIGTRLDATKIKYRSFLDNMRNEIRDKSFWDQQNAYASANPAYLSGAMQGAQGRQQMSQGQIQNPSGFLTNMMQVLRPQQNQPQKGFKLKGGVGRWGGMIVPGWGG